MIIVKLISGLGNQLFQYAVGRQLSITRNVPLKLDVSFFKSQKLRNYKLDQYNIQAEIATEQEIAHFLNVYDSKSIFARIYRRSERLLPKNRWRLYKQANWWTYEPDVLKVSSNVYLDGYWQHYKYFERFPSLIYNELTVKEPFNNSFSTLAKTINNHRSSVSIHIRHGDYISDSNANNLMGVLPLEYYYRAIQAIREQVNNPVFFIFSDNLGWVRDNLVISEQVVYVEAEGGEKDYLELQLMSKCHHNIIANSTFSWWGAFLNQAPDKIVIAPGRWVVPQELNKNVKLLFPSWISL